MILQTILGIALPFSGTTLGASLVFLVKGGIKTAIQKVLNGFTSGVMIAASFFSLLLPAIENSGFDGVLSFLPASIGFLGGMAFLMILDKIIPHLHIGSTEPEGIHSNLKKRTMMALAMTLHNIPEGIAVGIIYVSALSEGSTIGALSALSLSIGIAVQNLPEGAIVSLPYHASGTSKIKAFTIGVLSGVVEPIAAILAVLFSAVLVPILPYLLAFAAGAMIYVVVEELIPEMSVGKHTDIGLISFAIGFVAMMILDVAFG